MKYIHCLILLLVPLFSIGQDSLLLPNKVTELVEKNILISRIVAYKKYSEIRNPEYFCNKLLPNSDEVLDLKFEVSGLKYPIEGYKTYTVINNDFLFRDKNESFGTKKIGYTLKPEDNVLLSRYYLIAYNSNTKSLLFISENFIADDIRDDFSLDEEFTYAKLKKYLLFKLYNYRLKEFEMIKNNSHKVKIKAQSLFLQSKVEIRYNKKSHNIDIVKIKK